MNQAWTTAAGLGAVTGLRSMTGLAAVSRELSDRRRLPRHATRLEAWLADDLVAHTLTALAIGEIVADKLPGLPDRVAPAPLLGRGIIGGLLGAIAAGPDDRAVGAALGAGAALASAFVGWFIRTEAQRFPYLPDTALALTEDAFAVAAALELADQL